MKRFVVAALATFLAQALLVACGSTTDSGSKVAGPTGGFGGVSSGGSGAGGSGAGTGTGGSGGVQLDAGGGGSSNDGGACEPPDMLIVLDRTMSMHRRPDGTRPPDTTAGHQASKWYIAINAVEQLTGKLDSTIRFGLELFPKDPGNNQCVTLKQRINNITATNPACQKAEVLVQPGLNNGPAIASAIDPETTRLCTSTPIGKGIVTASQALTAIQTAGRDQYAVLITDGQDTCDKALVLSATQALAQQGIKLYAIGFDASSGNGVDKSQLNDLACAGHTAPGFPAPCQADAQGNYTATNPTGPDLFLAAGDAAALSTALTTLAGNVCCGCIS